MGNYSQEIEAGKLGKGDPKKDLRTLRCLLRKYLKVPRRDVSRMEQVGITSVRDLLQIHYTMVPDLWKRLRTHKGPQVAMVAWFCYWGQNIEYGLEEGPSLWAAGERPGQIADDVVERFISWRSCRGIKNCSYQFPWKEERKREKMRRKIALAAEVKDPDEIITYEDGAMGRRTWTPEEAEEARIREQQQAIWEVMMKEPQEGDGFKPDPACEPDSVGYETEAEDQARVKEFDADETAWRVKKGKDFLEMHAFNWVRGTTLERKLILSRIMNAGYTRGPEFQDRFIQEIHLAIYRKKREREDLAASTGEPVETIEWQEGVMEDFFIELEDPTNGPGWQKPAIELWRPPAEVGYGICDPVSRQAREQVLENITKVKLQVEKFNAAVAERQAWMRDVHGSTREVPEYAAVHVDVSELEPVPEPVPKRLKVSEDEKDSSDDSDADFPDISKFSDKEMEVE